MKDSGIEWIGEIPTDWETNAVSQLFVQIKNKNVGVKEKNLLSLSYGRIKRKSIDSTDGLLPESFDGYNIIEADDIVLRLTDLQNDQRSLRVGLSTERGIVTSAYLTIRTRTNACAKYLYYYLHSFDVAKGFYGMGAGVRQGLNWDGIKWIRVLMPSLSEQQCIADYLDRKCAEIDAVIADTQKTIDEYKALKQSIITEAVTKGIRPNRPMKDSGIEWIGEIPEDWHFTKVRNCLVMPITDGPHSTPELYDEGVAFISAEAVSCGNGRIDFSHKRGYISEMFYEECCKKYIPQIDDIYMIKSGATTGRVSIVDSLEPIFTIWSPLAVFRCNRAMMNPRFMFYALQSEGFQKQVALGWTYGTQQNIGMRTLEQLKVCVPSIAEQMDTMVFLDNMTKDIDGIINKKELLIAELESYKKSLIYEYVTGKKEVV